LCTSDQEEEEEEVGRRGLSDQRHQDNDARQPDVRAHHGAGECSATCTSHLQLVRVTCSTSAHLRGYLYICANPFIYATKFDPVKRVLQRLLPIRQSPSDNIPIT